MNAATIWLISSIMTAIALFIVWIVLKITKARKDKITLFGDSSPIFLRGLINKLNPFLIVKKNKELEELKKLQSKDRSDMVIFNKKEDVQNTAVKKRGPRQKKEGAAGIKDASKDIARKKKEKPEEKNKEDKQKLKGEKKKGIVVRVDNLDELAKRLKNKNIEYVLQYLKKENYSLLEKIFLKKTFESEKEFVDYLKEEIVVFLESQCNGLKDRISYLRKKGKDVKDMEFKVLSIPLKIRVFQASFESKDFDKVINLLTNLDEELKKLENVETVKNPEKDKTNEVKQA